MLAIQFQSTSSSKQRETRDMWEIRAQLQEEQEQQQSLYNQINELEATLQKYEEQSEQEQVSSLKESIEALEAEVGLTEITGKGIKISIDPIFVDSSTGQEYPMVSPELLSRLINELNTYGTQDMAIENERIVNTTPIRYVNGETYVNNHNLPDLPINVYVITDTPERLLNYMKVSQSQEDFAIENMSLSVTYEEKITLPPYQGRFDFDSVEVKEEVEDQ